MRKLTKSLRLARDLKSFLTATAIAIAEGHERITVSRAGLLGDNPGARGGAIKHRGFSVRLCAEDVEQRMSRSRTPARLAS